MSQLPESLKEDAITEALFEVRFSSSSPAEVAIGRLADLPQFNGFHHQRLAIADIPEPIRNQDQSLKYNATLQLSGSGRFVRVGPNVISYHIVAPYPGWATFYEELSHLVLALFKKLDNLHVVRLGLRYVNMLQSGRHLISGVEDIDISVRVGGDDHQGGMNLLLRTIPAPDYVVQTRIVTPDLVTGPNLPSDFSLMIDVDVATPTILEFKSKTPILDWLTQAHAFEKESFFKALPDTVIAELKES